MRLDAKIAAVLAAAMLAPPAFAVTEGWNPLTEGAGKSRLEALVRRELNRLPYLGVFDHLTFIVAGDTVTLQGQTVRPTLKRDAEEAVKRIEGVRAVNNQVEVLPLSSFDDELRVRAFYAVYGSQALNRYLIQPQLPVHIIVKNGHITLEGVVNSELERQVAYNRVRGLPGSFEVVNRLALDSEN